jgi:hypothetical protein
VRQHDSNGELVMDVDRVREFDAHKIEATFGIWHHDEGRMRNVVWGTYSDASQWDALDGLTVQGLIDDSDDAREGQVWTQTYDYKVIHRLDLEHAQACVKTLRRLERGLDKIRERRGYATDFADFLMRVAEVFGCRRYATYSSELRMDGTHWRFLTPDALRDWVRQNQKVGAALTRPEKASAL